MPFPVGGGTQTNVERAAEEIDGALATFIGQVKAFRALVAGGNFVPSLSAMNIYQAATSTRRFVQDQISNAHAAGLAQAFARRWPNRPDFNPAAEWATARAELNRFIAWMKNALPKDAEGNFAFHREDANGELASFDIPLTQPAKTALINRLDDLIAAFPQA